jgi:hypothetical protein
MKPAVSTPGWQTTVAIIHLWHALAAKPMPSFLARSAMMTVAILLLMETPRIPGERLGLAGGLFFTFTEIGGVLRPVTVGFLSGVSGDFVMLLAALTLICAGLHVLPGRMAN